MARLKMPPDISKGKALNAESANNTKSSASAPKATRPEVSSDENLSTEPIKRTTAKRARTASRDVTANNSTSAAAKAIPVKSSKTSTASKPESTHQDNTATKTASPLVQGTSAELGESSATAKPTSTSFQKDTATKNASPLVQGTSAELGESSATAKPTLKRTSASLEDDAPKESTSTATSSTTIAARPKAQPRTRRRAAPQATSVQQSTFQRPNPLPSILQRPNSPPSILNSHVSGQGVVEEPRNIVPRNHQDHVPRILCSNPMNIPPDASFFKPPRLPTLSLDGQTMLQNNPSAPGIVGVTCTSAVPAPSDCNLYHHPPAMIPSWRVTTGHEQFPLPCAVLLTEEGWASLKRIPDIQKLDFGEVLALAAHWRFKSNQDRCQRLYDPTFRLALPPQAPVQNQELPGNELPPYQAPTDNRPSLSAAPSQGVAANGTVPASQTPARNQRQPLRAQGQPVATLSHQTPVTSQQVLFTAQGQPVVTNGTVQLLPAPPPAPPPPRRRPPSQTQLVGSNYLLSTGPNGLPKQVAVGASAKQQQPPKQVAVGTSAKQQLPPKQVAVGASAKQQLPPKQVAVGASAKQQLPPKRTLLSTPIQTDQVKSDGAKECQKDVEAAQTLLQISAQDHTAGQSRKASLGNGRQSQQANTKPLGPSDTEDELNQSDEDHMPLD